MSFLSSFHSIEKLHQGYGSEKTLIGPKREGGNPRIECPPSWIFQVPRNEFNFPLHLSIGIGPGLALVNKTSFVPVLNSPNSGSTRALIVLVASFFKKRVTPNYPVAADMVNLTAIGQYPVPSS